MVDSWLDNFNQLKIFKKENGHPHVPPDHRLQEWCSTQRTAKKKGQLAHEKIKALDGVGFSWDVAEYIWLRWWHMVKENHGHACSKTKIWCHTQRRLKSSDGLKKDKIKMLNSIGFVWDQFGPWEDMYRQLVAFRYRRGDCLVPRNYPENRKLGRWCTAQREAKNTGSLSPDRVDKLEKIGFVWLTLSDQKWMEMFNIFSDSNSLSILDKTCVRDLEDWCKNQRAKFRSGRLSKDKLALLNKAGFVWDTSWEFHFKFLKRQISGVNSNDKFYKSFCSIDKWSTNQRKLKRLYRLSQEKIDKLDSIGFVWDLRKNVSI